MSWAGNSRISMDFRNASETVTGNELDLRYKDPDPIVDVSWGNGTGAGLANLVWRDTRTYDSTGVTLDLTTLAAASTNGSNAATFTAIKGLIVRNNDSAINVVVGNAASAQFAFGMSSGTTTITIKPGETKVLVHDRTAAGIDCTTNKNLKIAAASGTPSFTVAIWGLD